MFFTHGKSVYKEIIYFLSIYVSNKYGVLYFASRIFFFES